MILRILSVEKTIFNGPVESVELPGTCGRFVVLERHAPLISTLEKGEIVYQKDGQKVRAAIAGGIAEVRENRVSVCIN
ncbi:MAG: ATP synthase F1 subunit epsilon [Culturomica sp.]|jgi:F-type H+-transporting ATPase subunit epsilon|nr:ATP synthase F1 subunit epsilon [Culturomica sp.]